MARSLPAVLFTLILAFVLLTGPVRAGAEPFTLGCTLPWQPIAKKHAIARISGELDIEMAHEGGR